MTSPMEEMLALHRETVALLSETQARVAALNVAVRALIATNPSPSALHAAMLDEMDGMADRVPAGRIPMYRDTIAYLIAALPEPGQKPAAAS